MNTDLKPLAEANPVPLEDVAGWSDSAEGQRTLARVNDQLGDEVAAFTVQQARRHWPWLVAATAAAVVVLAVAIPVLFINDTTGGDGTAAPAETIVGSWTLVRLASGGQTVNLTTGDGNSTWVTMSDSGDITGAGPCNDLSASYVVDGAVLTFSEGIVSAVSCDPDMPDSGNLEGVIFSSLWGTPIELSFAGSDEMMWTFSDSGMATAMTFVRFERSTPDQEVQLGLGYVWRSEALQQDPIRLASAFAAEVLGWSGATATVLQSEGDPTDPVWVALRPPGLAEVVVVTVPTVDGGRVISHVGLPLLIENAEAGQSLTARLTIQDSYDAASIDVTMRTTNGDTTYLGTNHLSADIATAEGGYVALLPTGDPRAIVTALVRYLDADGRVIAVSGELLPPGGAQLSLDEVAQINVWVNGLGLIQVDEGVWRIRYDRMCGEGVWNTGVALRLGAEFIAYDLNAGVSVRDPSIGLPLPEDAASTLWMMAVNTCRDQFPEGSIEQGPPGLE